MSFESRDFPDALADFLPKQFVGAFDRVRGVRRNRGLSAELPDGPERLLSQLSIASQLVERDLLMEVDIVRQHEQLLDVDRTGADVFA